MGRTLGGGGEAPEAGALGSGLIPNVARRCGGRMALTSPGPLSAARVWPWPLVSSDDRTAWVGAACGAAPTGPGDPPPGGWQSHPATPRKPSCETPRRLRPAEQSLAGTLPAFAPLP